MDVLGCPASLGCWKAPTLGDECCTCTVGLPVVSACFVWHKPVGSGCSQWCEAFGTWIVTWQGWWILIGSERTGHVGSTRRGGVCATLGMGVWRERQGSVIRNQKGKAGKWPLLWSRWSTKKKKKAGASNLVSGRWLECFTCTLRFSLTT